MSSEPTVSITRQDLMDLRQYLLGVVAVIERKNGDPVTTSDMRRWVKRFGPAPDEMREQLER